MSEHTASRALSRGLAATAALAVGAAGLFVGGTAAFADNIDTAKTGSIIVHKFENPGNGTMNPDGTGSAPKTKPIAGVGFEVCHVDGIDLTAAGNTGWNQVKAVSNAQLLAAQSGTQLASYTLSNCTALPDTDAAGVASSGRLALGAYLVREVKAPANAAKKADPFIVTVPTPSVNSGTGTGAWVYDVNVYPKNTVGNPPVKRIDGQAPSSAAVGSDVQFSVEQIVPGIAAGETYQKFTLSDTLDGRLSPKVGTVKVLVDGVALAAADFTTTGSAGQTVKVQLTASGLAKLSAGAKVRFEFAATITSVGDGKIENTAFVNVNDMDYTPAKPGEPGGPDPENPTNTVKTRWGQAQITKVDPSKKGLTGAEFEVRMGDTAECTADTVFADVKDPADTSKKLVISSGANGVVNIPGLWVGSDSVNDKGEETIGLATRCYQLVEVKAPAGFVLPTGADALTNVVVKPGTTANAAIDIENKQQEVPELPLTGAAGQVLMIAGGLALVAVAAGTVLISRRKQQRA
ncbi:MULTISPECIES: SpaH/EbpB family LPXTG-anchored major pilin [unclassified Leucobacter]|uniref:SpaH/EbpB family LPXTG-anchored major pilin n=1 Tax=unclassified Leucobacter TaxID=2621730 RepID=UPI00069A4E60|nr:SpaH/EbpB family LPXTG-anchored major pilin [Leucobacter sp. Ag1]